MLAHKASEEGVVTAEIIAGHKAKINYMAIPNVVYTFPEVSAVGMTEEEAKALGRKLLVGSFPFKANSRARCTGEDIGLVKVVADEETHRLLGLHMIGPSASELIAEGVLAIEKKATLEDIANSCQAHPTLSEAIKEACLSALKRPIHI
jgi:dihydrolipoamide dehydrogenase